MVPGMVSGEGNTQDMAKEVKRIRGKQSSEL